MARRLQFSVVGLPHYTIWHLYEPSVDDMKHMEEMEKEKKVKEQKEKEQKEKIEKIKSQFDIPSQEWTKDKQMFEDIAKKASEAASKGKVPAGPEMPEQAPGLPGKQSAKKPGPV